MLKPNKRCKLDLAVAPIAWLLVNELDQLKENCEMNTGLSVEDMRNTFQQEYAPADKRHTRTSLRNLMNELFVTGFSSLIQYESRMKCARYVMGTLSSPYDETQIYDVDVVEDGSNQSTSSLPTTLASNTVLYHFTEYAMVEVAPLWWVKCHLLSGLKVSDTDEVSCDAWSRSIQANQIGDISFKQWLQQTARSIAPLPTLEDTAEKRVQELGKESLLDEHGNMTFSNASITPVCFSARIFKQSQSLDFANMMYASYRTGRDATLRQFINEKTDSCPNIDHCAPSTREVPANRVIDTSSHGGGYDSDDNIVDLVSQWLFDEMEYGRMVTQLSDDDMMETRISNWENPELELFSQPWLHMDTFTGNQFSSTLSASIHGQFPGISEDACVPWWSGSDSFKNTKGECIYRDEEGEHDPIRNSHPPTNGKTHVVEMYTSDGFVEEIDVCKPQENTDPNTPDYPRAGFLNQPCWIGGSSTTDEQFTCTENDETLDCSKDGDTIANPNPGRVCYEMGNTCFNSRSNNLRFQNELDFTWKYAILPVGVKMKSYGQQIDKNLLIGRNPRYTGETEKLFWNNTFFDRTNVESRVNIMKANYPNQHTFARYLPPSIVSTVIPDTANRRRLLNSDASIEKRSNIKQNKGNGGVNGEENGSVNGNLNGGPRRKLLEVFINNVDTTLMFQNGIDQEEWWREGKPQYREASYMNWDGCKNGWGEFRRC